MGMIELTAHLCVYTNPSNPATVWVFQRKICGDELPVSACLAGFGI